MNFAAWLAERRRLRDGLVAAMARHFEISTSAVMQWGENGVPIERITAVRDFTGNEVTVEEMVAERAAPSEAEGVA